MNKHTSSKKKKHSKYVFDRRVVFIKWFTIFIHSLCDCFEKTNIVFVAKSV